MKPRLSVILITRNEASRLGTTLDAIAFADEIVVLDSGSTDGTVELARRYSDKVYVSDGWPGFGPQKNRALELASGDWVLSLDADELVTPELEAEILAAIASPQAEMYELPRLSSFCGRRIQHSGWWPDYVPRLFRRGTARFSDDLVHERLLFQGVSIKLKQPLLHESFRTVEEVLNKVNHYSSAGAEQALRRGKQGGLGKAVAHGLWAFLRTYFLRAGFLDGREGFILAISSAEGVYYRYLKLMYLQRMTSGE